MSDLGRLQRRLGYTFKDETLLKQALTHRSVSSNNNERLEFLGDALLGVIIAEALFQKFPKSDEGDLSRLRASLVKGATLAEVGHSINLGDYLILGSGELKSGGFRRDSILACGIEALIGAAYLEDGFDSCRSMVLTLLEPQLNKASPDTVQKDPKTRLQEHLQGSGAGLPKYVTTNIEGEPHDQTFYVECHIDGLTSPATGSGASRRRAEQAAATNALNQLQTAV